jgi:acetyl-CoA carboxylase carboxyl transferase subunit beta
MPEVETMEPKASSPSAREAIAALVDEFESAGGPVSADPLRWPGYPEQLKRAAAASGEDESVLSGRARIGEEQFVLIAMDFNFLGGSMGAASGARIVRAFDEARAERLPVVSLIASGGARMQEGMCSLVQMQRVAAAQARTRSEGIPHIAVLRQPTTGGVWAALGSVADVIFAISDSTVAFAGARVRGAAEIREPEFSSEGQFEAGVVDRVLDEGDVRSELKLALRLLQPFQPGPVEPADVPAALGWDRPDAVGGAWEHVLRARSFDRPRAPSYLDAYFDERLELSGDRAGGLTSGLLFGVGRREDRSIAYAAQTGAATGPGGYRAAMRLIELAARLRLPVLTLIDTPGAANDAAAERGGVGTAIGELFQRVAASPVPITSLVIGEGGSGGALALASPERLWIVPAGYFAVIAPEGAAAILARDTSRAPELAERIHLLPKELLRLGVVHGVARVSGDPTSDSPG